jgi:hypothetical protein
MKKLFMVIGIAALLITTAHAQRTTTTTTTTVRTTNPSFSDQSYTTALGLKVWGDGGGVSLKHFVTSNNAFEGIGYFWNYGVRITGLYEFHFDIPEAPGLKWYVGPGAHIGFYNDRYYHRYYRYDEPRTGSFVGIDGVLGLDYKFDGVPINLSLDWQPSFEFGDSRGFIGSWGGLGIRYTLK